MADNMKTYDNCLLTYENTEKSKKSMKKRPVCSDMHHKSITFWVHFRKTGRYSDAVRQTCGI